MHGFASTQNQFFVPQSVDIRKSQLVAGRSINLALSARGRKALFEVGLEERLLDHGIPMKGRMLHDIKGRTTFVPYDRNTNQVIQMNALYFDCGQNFDFYTFFKCIYSVGRKHLNEILLTGNTRTVYFEFCEKKKYSKILFLTATDKYPNIHLHFNRKLTTAKLKHGELNFTE